MKPCNMQQPHRYHSKSTHQALVQRSSAHAKALSSRFEAEHRAVARVCLLCVHPREAMLFHASLQQQGYCHCSIVQAAAARH